MKKILILGHKGMLGDAVSKYFAGEGGYGVATIAARWPDGSFAEEIRQTRPDFIVNCIGKIPQRKPTEDEYRETNIDLPGFLETLGIPIMHPSTDCEFKGDIPAGSVYTKYSLRDAEDAYGTSKAFISEEIERSFKNTKIIRTSIIGHEPSSHVSLLDWLLSSEGEVKGYTNHYWNGITTLEWSKLAQKVLEDWDAFPVLSQYGTEDFASKYEVLNMIKEIYDKDISILPFEAPLAANKCLASDEELPGLQEQLKQLKAFYSK
jgi:dTDP-4-dehydrorhamnose reductase